MTSASPIPRQHPLIPPTLVPKPAPHLLRAAGQAPLTSPGRWWGRRTGSGTWLRVQGSTSRGDGWRAPVGTAAREAEGPLRLGLGFSGCTRGARDLAAFILSEGSGRGGLLAADQSESGTERCRGRGGGREPNPLGAGAGLHPATRVQPSHGGAGGGGGSHGTAFLRAEKSQEDEMRTPSYREKKPAGLW